MKKIILILSVCVALLSSAQAQVCTPDSAHFTSGVYVYPPSLPCITQGIAYSGTVSIRVPDSIDASNFISGLPANTYYLYVDSMAIDSITGFPAGISSASNPATGTWMYGGAYGCSTFSGTTSAAVGQYGLNVFGRGCAHGTFFGQTIDTCISGSLASYFGYNLNVCQGAAPSICTPDTAAFTNGVYLYPASLPCINQGMAYSGTVSIRVPDSIDAHTVVSALPANTYYLHIDSMKIDSITGMPAGITVASLPGDSVWLHGGQYGCAVFSGTTSVPQGNYPIGIYGRGCVHGLVFTFVIDSCLSGSLSSFFNFSLNVCGTGGACTIDTTHFTNTTHVYPPSLPCITSGTPFAGQINIQIPDTLDAHDFNAIIPSGYAYVIVDSININSITGYPAGISSISNPVIGSWLEPMSYACAAISGTVNGNTTAAGNYPLTITGTACGHGTFPLIGFIDTCITNFNFSQAFPYKLSVCYPAGITELSDGVGLNIYPNPNQGNFTVTVSSESRMTGTLSVLDQLGRSLTTQSLDVNGTAQIALDLGNIAPGAYILMINAGEKKSVKQFIVR